MTTPGEPALSLEAFTATTTQEPVPTGSPRSRRRTVLMAVALLFGLLLLASIILLVFLRPRMMVVSGGAMEPTHTVDDRILVMKLGATERGDIVTFDPDDVEGVAAAGLLMKRVVATGGETVTLVDGEVFVDGERLDEPYLESDTSTERLRPDNGDPDEWVVPEGHVFLLGDNRFRSTDSRVYGAIPESAIVANTAWVVSGG